MFAADLIVTASNGKGKCGKNSMNLQETKVGLVMTPDKLIEPNKPEKVRSTLKWKYTVKELEKKKLWIK